MRCMLNIVTFRSTTMHGVSLNDRSTVVNILCGLGEEHYVVLAEKKSTANDEHVFLTT